MLDIEKVVQEFVFLRENLLEIAKYVKENQQVDAAFKLGCLHTICNHHVINLRTLIPNETEQLEENEDAVA